MSLLNPNIIKQAHQRVKDYVPNTPIFESKLLNEYLGNRIHFKMDSLQTIGAFKQRGAFNAVLAKLERGEITKDDTLIAFSSGNHGIALSYVAKCLGMKAKIYITDFTSPAKVAAIKSYGAEIDSSPLRTEAEEKAYSDKDNVLIKPYDDDDIIAGAGGACYEALENLNNVDSVFATCGGGGWLSGTYLAKELVSPETKVFGVEPAEANDAFLSLNNGVIYQFQNSPDTIADGARTLNISGRTLQFLEKLDGFYLADEEEIYYWTQWLTHLLRCNVEPTSALSMCGVTQYIKENNIKDKDILVLVSGGNIGYETYTKIYQKNRLDKTPNI